MKRILLLPLLLPFAAAAQNAAILATQPAKAPLLEGFAQLGYVHELWVVTDNLPYGYSSLSYTGNGFYAGGGLRSRMDSKRPLGFGLSLDYLQYTMGKPIQANEEAPLAYAFARFTPMVYYTFNTKSKFTFTARGDIGLLAAIRNNERGYAQFGLRGCVGYKAYEANIGFSFSQAGRTPATGVDSKWREQMFSLGIACYPYRIKGFRHTTSQPKTK